MLDDGDRRVLREFDLTNRQYHALQLLAPGTSRHLTEMSELLFCDKSNVTGLVERMVRDGLVERDRSDSDRRYLQLTITEQGDAHEASLADRLGTLTAEEHETLNALLAKLSSGVRASLD